VTGSVKAETAQTPAPTETEPAPVALPLQGVDHSDPTLLHEQVAGEIRRAIAAGEASPGDRIPKAKDLAGVLGVNTNTVLRALRILRDDGLVEMRRGRGIIVSGTAEHSAVIQGAHQLVNLARQHGYRRDELIRLIQNLPT
jgi:GntR family transcriptional regulator